MARWNINFVDGSCPLARQRIFNSSWSDQLGLWVWFALQLWFRFCQMVVETYLNMQIISVDCTKLIHEISGRWDWVIYKLDPYHIIDDLLFLWTFWWGFLFIKNKGENLVQSLCPLITRLISKIKIRFEMVNNVATAEMF